jgi:glycosyltransferase involved in cell wall biosynthesis
MPNYNILHLVNEFEDKSVTRIVEKLIQKLRGPHFQFHVGSLRTQGSMQTVYRLLGAETIVFSMREGGLARTLKDLRHYIDSQHIDLIHSHSPRTALVLALSTVARPHVPHLHTKHILTFPRDRSMGVVYTIVDRVSLYLPDHIVAVSNAIEKHVESFPGMTDRQISTIHNGIAYDRFFTPQTRDVCRTELGINLRAQVVGFTGRLEPIKHLDLLLRAFADATKDCPNAILLMVGDGSMRAKLEHLSATLNISDRVIWAGFQSDIPRLLATMDIYVQPSINEGLPLSVLEAMAAGKAIIATDVGGIREILTCDQTAVVVPSGDLSALSSGLNQLLVDVDRQQALGKAARSFVQEHFGVDNMVSKYEQLYRQYLS